MVVLLTIRSRKPTFPFRVFKFNRWSCPILSNLLIGSHFEQAIPLCKFSQVSAKMTDFLQRMDNINLVIKEFRKEQEKILLHSVNDMKYGKTAKIKLQGPAPTSTEIEENNMANISKIINLKCVLMPQPASDSSYKKLWPLALTVSSEESKIKLGMIESFGSLWMLVHRKDAQPGYRVLLQTAVRMNYFIV